jgi:methylglutaconyl-CoA hydratase
MKTSAKLSYDENIKDAAKLLEMFEALSNLPIPKIALVRGAAYGGAVGIIACCDYAIAAQDAKFCLSEVKLGLLPAVIAPYLLRKMRAGMLKRFALSGMVFSAGDAFDAGLVEIVTDSPDQKLTEELNLLLACSPTAQAAINQLFSALRENAYNQSQRTVEAIAKARTSKDGQDGLSCFFSKTEPPWLRELES